ncbi:hypothetical protein I7G86_19475 [Sinorhizobium meliloti]|nr:hypothetical protein [Sinorhizobium meliloti]ARS67264.1 hypothetical protein SMRU11_08795 [Sinorhizobium meliloti RU11/001]MDE3763927.1 hypothetical protein [Sinorhizobium meliloti]MDE3776289.1 hypothetical protein [Sinorhizobium meliloti]MDE3792807.1 hypothetical protein [Sinorhizobium meliloti]MDE3805041.1 hypothetical protein [Sinorhizobium meliloti]
MGDRKITNLLLAVIAAVLLFGSSAVTGALKWLAIIGAALLILYAVVALAQYLLRECAKTLHEAKARGRDALVMRVFGLVAMASLALFGGYALLLRLGGIPEPFAATTHSWIGTIWGSILIVGGMAVALSRLYTHRANILSALRYGLFLLIRSPLAPVLLPIYGWRKARMAGDGVVSSTITAFIGLFFGFVVWAILVGSLATLLGPK